MQYRETKIEPKIKLDDWIDTLRLDMVYWKREARKWDKVSLSRWLDASRHASECKRLIQIYGE